MTRFSRQTAGDDTELSIPLEKVCFIIMKAREFDAKDVETEPASGSNPADDHEIGVLEDRPDDPSLDELNSLISDLSVDEQIDLVALVWLGRDEYPDDWESVRAAAADAHNEHTADYLTGNPLLADHLSDGLSILGLSCADYELKHL
ncbi:DUF3775 domain-containing protein [Chelativorans xinjiangense]|uniref:DUF3775 domain-containing protein n=1 Tax=Chelativorans xinjiangense TaxID=2681485 RepID=UPI00135724E9|nr:DUF3775 domain-containing protein [Chelativorans xinjiangense]